MLRNRNLFEPTIVFTNHEYRFLAVGQIKDMDVKADVALEPAHRDSGLAVAVRTELALRRAPETIVAVFAADHVTDHRDRFKALCAEAADAAAAGLIVTFRIQPSGPATGFG